MIFPRQGPPKCAYITEHIVAARLGHTQVLHHGQLEMPLIILALITYYILFIQFYVIALSFIDF